MSTPQMRGWRWVKGKDFRRADSIDQCPKRAHAGCGNGAMVSSIEAPLSEGRGTSRDKTYGHRATSLL
jgi:hypothetical protein